MSETITDKNIRDVVAAFVEIANLTGALDQVTTQYPTGGRSLAIKVVGKSKFTTGFVMRDGRIDQMRDGDTATVTATFEKTTFWKVINSQSAEVAKITLQTALFTEQTISMDPPIGSGAELHFENILKIFDAVAKVVM